MRREEVMVEAETTFLVSYGTVTSIRSCSSDFRISAVFESAILEAAHHQKY